MRNEETLDKYYGKSYSKKGSICPRCGELKHYFDYATMCNDCYIWETRGIRNSEYGE